VLLVRVKSILGVGPKVKESMKDPFKFETWLRSVHDGLRVIVKGMITVIGFVGLAAPKWFFSSQSFYFVNKYLVFFEFRI
jgi:hypothetical protein